jgi:hypothetical protein
VEDAHYYALLASFFMEAQYDENKKKSRLTVARNIKNTLLKQQVIYSELAKTDL